MKLKNYPFKQLITDIEEQILSLEEIAFKHSLYYYEVLIVYNKLENLKTLKPKKLK